MLSGDYYRVMGLKPTADDEEIRKTYRRLIRMYHPDLNKAPGASDTLKRIIDAYKVLGNPKRRSVYHKLSAMYGARPIQKSGGARLVRHCIPRQATRRRDRTPLAGLLLVVALMLIVALVWQSFGAEARMKQWCARPDMNGFLNERADFSPAVGLHQAGVDIEYLRQCVQEYRQDPTNPESIIRLANAYLSATQAALDRQDDSQAVTFALAAEQILGDQSPPMLSLLRDMQGPGQTFEPISASVNLPFSEVSGISVE